MLPSIPHEPAVRLAMAHLASMAEDQADSQARAILLGAHKALGLHLEAQRYNQWARAATRCSRARVLRRRHQGRCRHA